MTCVFVSQFVLLAPVGSAGVCLRAFAGVAFRQAYRISLAVAGGDAPFSYRSEALSGFEATNRAQRLGVTLRGAFR